GVAGAVVGQALDGITIPHDVPDTDEEEGHVSRRRRIVSPECWSWMRNEAGWWTGSGDVHEAEGNAVQRKGILDAAALLCVGAARSWILNEARKCLHGEGQGRCMNHQCIEALSRGPPDSAEPQIPRHSNVLGPDGARMDVGGSCVVVLGGRY